MVPILADCECEAVLSMALASAGDGRVTLVGIVRVPEGQSLSSATIQARKIRQFMKAYAENTHVRVEEHVFVSHNAWSELVNYIQQKKPDLLVLEWPRNFAELGIQTDGWKRPPCDLAIINGPINSGVSNILVPIRGGPYAELALRLSLAIAHSQGAKVTSLHIAPTSANTGQDAPYRGIEKILVHMPEIDHKTLSTSDPARSIFEESQQYDLVILGATARQDDHDSPIGPVAELIQKRSGCGVIVVKTRRPAPVNFESETISRSAISILVDKWFAENTYHAEEFINLQHLVDLKLKQKLKISLALPALNEEKTVGKVISTIKSHLMEKAPLLDEILLIDSNSTDRTREIASDLGVPVYIHQNLLPQYGPRTGKGEALWKSLLVSHGDIILWIDTDIINIQPHFVYGLVGPLLIRPEIQFVKGFYQRPLRVGDKLQAGGGGRVTELTARPLVNLFYPELSGLIQPLAGEYGGRRSAMEQMPFSSGYGVEIGLLIDLLDSFGLSAIAQVDLKERVHHNQPLEALSKMSFTIIQAVFRRLEKRYNKSFLDDINRTMKLIRYEPGRFFLEVEEIVEQERPAMIDIPEYVERPL